MGYMKHDAIIVTAFRDADIQAGADRADQIGLTRTSVAVGPSNHHPTFLIVPDGSKEGWADSDFGDVLRGEWKAWARGAYAERVFLEWVHVSYDESGACRIVDQWKKDE